MIWPCTSYFLITMLDKGTCKLSNVLHSRPTFCACVHLSVFHHYKKTIDELKVGLYLKSQLDSLETCNVSGHYITNFINNKLAISGTNICPNKNMGFVPTTLDLSPLSCNPWGWGQCSRSLNVYLTEVNQPTQMKTRVPDGLHQVLQNSHPTVTNRVK